MEMKKSGSLWEHGIVNRLTNQTVAQCIFLIIATLAVYLHTLDVPFYLDDFHTISERALLYKENDLLAIWNYSPARFVAFFSFYLNYKIGALNLAAYHAVNIAIHCLAGLLVYTVVRLLLKTPALNATPSSNLAFRFLPLLVAALFLLHPLQTQAVTYIVQRMTSLAALFYLASIACYLKARFVGKPNLWFLGAVLLALIAFVTKQNTLTLPFAIILIEIFLFRLPTTHPRRLAIVVIGTGIGLLAGLQFLYFVMGHREFLTPATLLSLTTETDAIGRLQYFYSQQEVLWRYIGLFFWPVGQRLDYTIVIPPTLWLYPTVIFFLGHLAILYGAYLSRNRWPLVAFGICFYYLTHAVESSFLPIRDLMFEHRTYLPNLGLAIALCAGILHMAHKIPASFRLRWVPAVLFGIVITTLLYLTWQRNNLWRDDVAFLAENAKLSPTHYRPLSQLGLAYMNRKQYKRGVESLKQAIRVYNVAMGNTGDLILPPEIFSNLLLGKTFVGESAEVLVLVDRLLKENTPNPKELARLRMIQGAAYFNQRDFSKAEQHLREAMALDEQDVAIKVLLIDVLKMAGKGNEAESMDSTINQLMPYLTVRP